MKAGECESWGRVYGGRELAGPGAGVGSES